MGFSDILLNTAANDMGTVYTLNLLITNAILYIVFHYLHVISEVYCFTVIVFSSVYCFHYLSSCYLQYSHDISTWEQSSCFLKAEIDPLPFISFVNETLLKRECVFKNVVYCIK